MKSREEAVKKVKELLTTDETLKPNVWHFGRIELEMLFDYIYEGKANNNKERIISAKSFDKAMGELT